VWEGEEGKRVLSGVVKGGAGKSEKAQTRVGKASARKRCWEEKRMGDGNVFTGKEKYQDAGEKEWERKQHGIAGMTQPSKGDSCCESGRVNQSSSLSKKEEKMTEERKWQTLDSSLGKDSNCQGRNSLQVVIHA